MSTDRNIRQFLGRPFVILLLCSSGRLAYAQDEIVPAADAPPPKSTEESLKAFRVPDGLAVELVAAEPLLSEPTGMCFDARGRMFVCELHGYNRDGYYDIVELNKQGVLDKTVRRIPATKEAEQLAAQETYGTVKLLESSRGDGRFDRATVFADYLPPCYGLIAVRDGVLAICAPDVVFLADRDGDGKADVREVLFTGFGIGEIWSRINSPQWGPDNWIYVAAGAACSGTIRGPHLNGEVSLGNTCFRFKPDGTRLEPATGGTSGFGLAIDDWGDRFLVTNQQHALFVAPFPFQALARNPLVAVANPISNISSYGHPAKVTPASTPDPWRRRRGEQAEWVKFYGTAETDEGNLTSACAPLIYSAGLLPQEYWNNHFSCEPAQNLIHRCLLEPAGAGYAVKRADAGHEFLASSDGWFRPVHLTVGPEGAIYIVDMYREIIEDYSAIPRYLQQQYVEGLRNGIDRGRIWRIVPDREFVAPSAKLADLESKSLVSELANSIPWRRVTAQRLLLERNAVETAPALKTMAQSAPAGPARLHALYTLDGLGALTPEVIQRSLQDESVGVRVHALQLSERWLESQPALQREALALADDSHLKVRLQLAFSLGECSSDAAMETLARLARRDAGDSWLSTALLSSVRDRSGRMIARLLDDQDERYEGELLQPLGAIVGARGDRAELGELLQRTATWSEPEQTESLLQVLAGLSEGLERSTQKLELTSPQQRALEQLLEHPRREARLTALGIATKLGGGEWPAARSLRQSMTAVALDGERQAEERIEALDFMARAPLVELESLQPLISPREPIDVQLAVVRALSSSAEPAIVSMLLAPWESCTPRVQLAIIDSLLSRTSWLPLLLDEIESGRLPASSLSSARQAQLLEIPDAEIRERAQRLFAAAPTSEERKQVIERYRAGLQQEPDLVRGKEVFERQCLKCHRLLGAGHAVGPDLAAVQNRPDESLLVDILDPSSTITVGFTTYQALTHSGRVFSGVLTEETATSIALRRENGEQQVILRGEIDVMAASQVSMMPSGIEKEVSPQDLVSLIGYLRAALKKESPEHRPAP